MDLPAGLAQDYIAVAGIAAVYVASASSGACRIDVTRDSKRTQTMLRKQSHDWTIVSALWASDPETAGRIAHKANKSIRHAGAPLTEAEATMLIKAAAASLKVHLTAHAAVLERVESAMAHVKAALEQARKNGGLQWFNRAFQDFQLRAKACGHPSMTYAQAHARLRQVMIRRKLAGEPADSGVSMLPLVFPELSQ